MSLDEERALFANWAIVSSPLVLGLDVRNASQVERYWPIIANERALRVNGAWAGSAGDLLKASATSTNRRVQIGAACEVRSNNTADLPNWLVYAKPLPEGEVAVLAINVGEEALLPSDGAAVSLAELLAFVANSTVASNSQESPERPTSFHATDVWSGAPLAALGASHPWSAAGLSPHNSSFVVFTPAA